MTDRQRKALAALVRAPTMKAAAKSAGVNYSTMRKWISHDEEFKRAYYAELAALVDDASLQVRQAMSEAVSTLREIAHGGELESNRLSAARSILSDGAKLIELQTLEHRITELERILTEEKE